MRRIGAAATLAAALCAPLIAGCGSDRPTETTNAASPDPVVEKENPKVERERSERERREREAVAPSLCPEGVSECAEAEGRVVYVEKVDPDGDGDAHFVIVDWPGVSLPGLTAIDVRKGLRPDPLPRHGVLVSAAGPVQVGSHGQDQIHALVLHVAGE
jgi:hypothetical protein